ncbi:unnamed protein product [Echinostoma caproni]|uniref:DUF4757 domain-containing protein n=1 Tax=Echinostoma caproni TaxID=27848 RepID=A0A183A7F3_9TREM|nr:unnamed protein product [Echinostoma caproni]
MRLDCGVNIAFTAAQDDDNDDNEEVYDGGDGLYVDGLPSVDSCSWKAPWNEVTRQQERYLRSKYSLFCGICKIQRVLRLDPQYHNRSDTCYVAHSPNPNEVTTVPKLQFQ